MASIEDSVIRSINKNGFPQKRVSLPFKAVFGVCKRANIPLSVVLKNLEDKAILNEIRGDKIVFFSSHHAPQTDNQSSTKIPTDTFEEMIKKMKKMDPAELEKIRQKVMEMTQAERDELLKKTEDFMKSKGR